MLTGISCFLLGPKLCRLSKYFQTLFIFVITHTLHEEKQENKNKNGTPIKKELSVAKILTLKNKKLRNLNYKLIKSDKIWWKIINSRRFWSYILIIYLKILIIINFQMNIIMENNMRRIISVSKIRIVEKGRSRWQNIVNIDILSTYLMILLNSIKTRLKRF